MQAAAWLNAEWLRAALYVAVIIACLVAGWRELVVSHTAQTRGCPRFWFLAAAAVAVLLIGRLSGIGSTAYELGRHEAIARGWYWSARRRLQGAAILIVGAATLAGLVSGARLMGDRLRRYLAPLGCVLALAGFAAARIVSLHQVDTLLYRRPILGARIASILELMLTVATLGFAVQATRSASAQDTARPPDAIRERVHA
jgi:hypothetical protein